MAGMVHDSGQTSDRAHPSRRQHPHVGSGSNRLRADPSLETRSADAAAQYRSDGGARGAAAMCGARSAAYGYSRARLTQSANADTRATARLLQQLARGPMKKT